MTNKRYSTDLSDAEWSLLEPHLPAAKKRGRPRLHSPREILDAVFYVLKSGRQWRMWPRDFPLWNTVFHYFGRWRIEGTWERMIRALRRRLRRKLGREPEPSAGIVDARSVKTTGVGGEQRGFDCGKKVRGRKRHILVENRRVAGRGQGAQRQGSRPGRHKAPARSRAWPSAAPLLPVGGRRLPGP